MARILVVDDDPQIRELLRQLFEHSGYEVAEASDGEEALKRHNESPADLVVNDLIMPGKEGMETIIEFRHNSPGVKIVAITGAGCGRIEGYLYTAKKLGAHRTLAKPFDLMEMLKAVNELLDS